MMLVLLAFSSLISQTTLDLEMSPQEKKKTGVYKLSEKEKSTLHNWIDNHYAKRDEPLESAAQEKGTLQENLNSGSYIRLSDNSLWNIHPKDVSITQGWITPVDILVSQSGDPNYPYKLTNSLTGSSVRARKAESVPAQQAPSSPAEHPSHETP